MKNMMPIILVMLIIVIAGFVFAIQGINMHSQVAVEEAKFHQLQNNYFLQSKEVRDAAATNSELNQQLVQIQNYPSELLRLKLVGVGKILTGIFGLLLAILIVLFMMPIRLAKLMAKPNGH